MEEKKIWKYLDKIFNYVPKGIIVLLIIMIVLFLLLLFIYHVLHIDTEIVYTLFAYIYIALITMFIYCIIFTLQSGFIGFCAPRHISDRSNLIWSIIITLSSIYFTYLVMLSL